MLKTINSTLNCMQAVTAEHKTNHRKPVVLIGFHVLFTFIGLFLSFDRLCGAFLLHLGHISQRIGVLLDLNAFSVMMVIFSPQITL